MILSKGSDEKYCKFSGDIKETCVYVSADSGVVDQDPIGSGTFWKGPIWIRNIFSGSGSATKSVQNRFFKSLVAALLYSFLGHVLEPDPEPGTEYH
jgi:hypothetical protein